MTEANLPSLEWALDVCERVEFLEEDMHDAILNFQILHLSACDRLKLRCDTG